MLVVMIGCAVLYYVAQPSPHDNNIVLLWDRFCKAEFTKYLNDNNIEYTLVKDDYIGSIYKCNNLFFCLMNRHPQQYTDINKLANEIYSAITELKINGIISFSTAGSNIHSVGKVIQFSSAIIDTPSQYKFNTNFVLNNNILYKSSAFVEPIDPITNTKGFNDIPANHSGQDEFVIYFISNKFNIPAMTLTGITDSGKHSDYSKNGTIVARNISKYFFTHCKYVL